MGVPRHRAATLRYRSLQQPGSESIAHIKLLCKCTAAAARMMSLLRCKQLSGSVCKAAPVLAKPLQDWRAPIRLGLQAPVAATLLQRTSVSRTGNLALL